MLQKIKIFLDVMLRYVMATCKPLPAGIISTIRIYLLTWC